MAIQQRIDELVSEFSSIAEWEDRYSKIIGIGKELDALEDEHKIAKNIVKGCQSQVWLVASLEGDKVILRGDSDAVIVRGLVSLLLKVYSGATLDEILTTPPTFLEDLGFKNNLSPSRANGLFAMVKQIKLYALAFKTLQG